jgi:hypothetical protein
MWWKVIAISSGRSTSYFGLDHGQNILRASRTVPESLQLDLCDWLRHHDTIQEPRPASNLHMSITKASSQIAFLG